MNPNQPSSPAVENLPIMHCPKCGAVLTVSDIGGGMLDCRHDSETCACQFTVSRSDAEKVEEENQKAFSDK